MATIYLKLSKRVNPVTNLAEVILRLRNGNDYDILAKSGIYITPDNFRNGEIKVNYRKVGNDTRFHEEQARKMSELQNTILTLAVKEKSKVSKEWLQSIIANFVRGISESEVKEAKNVYQLYEEYLEKKDFSLSHRKASQVVIRDLARFEGYIRSTDKHRKDYSFDVNTVTRTDIEMFREYLKDEKQLSEKYPKLFETLLSTYPAGVKHGQKVLEERGHNTIIKLMKKLKAFFTWLYETDRITNRPFDGIKIGSETFGTPYYISIEERNQIADFDFSGNKHLETQRDIFVFHCMVGCRVGDLMKLTSKNIYDNILIYTPHKTKDDGNNGQARVPLLTKALELIEKYKGFDPEGRLFPFISPQKYNDAIKTIFTRVGITRFVEVRNAKTGEDEIRPINEVASSHLARRTFIGNAYLRVQDPNLIGKMSGHTNGSRAFSRYRNIEDETLKNIVELMK